MNIYVLDSLSRKLIAILAILISLVGCGEKDENNSQADQSQPPTISLTATPMAISSNGATSLSWNSAYATSCTASGDWSGNKDTSGSEIISQLQTDSTFTLLCTGDGGSISDSVSVMVSPQPVVTVTLSASPINVSLNGSTTLSWVSSNADGCTASGDWSGSKNTSGTEIINALTLDSHFILSCSDANGSVSDSVDVTITLSGDNGTALLSWTPPTQNTDGSVLTDLAGYKIYYGTASNNYSETITINNSGLSSYQIDNLTAADWYFVVTSINSSGIESSYSTEVSKTIH
jgi:hypothetical protein